MKNIILFLLIFSLCSCSNKPKYELLINDYLSVNIDDYSTYELINFSTILYDSSSFLNDTVFKQIELKQNYYEFQLKEQLNISTTDIEQFAIDTSNVDFNDSLLHYINKGAEFVDLYKPTQIGWKIKHKFRINDKITTAIFHFDMDITKIIYVEFPK